MDSATACRGRAFAGLHRSIQILILGFIFLLLPTQSFATGAIAGQVAAACAPSPTMPDVGSCSACHSTTNNRGPNDLTAAGMWSLSSATFMNFCPAATPPPTPIPPTPTPTPPPATPPPGSPTTPPPAPTPGMGGTGASMDDDDDGDSTAEMDDDDDGGSIASSVSQRLRALRSRLRALGRD